MKSELSAPHFHDEAAAFAYVEAKLWPNGPVCPHCGTLGKAGRLLGKSARPGLWKCYACRKQFTVRVGTIFEIQPCPDAYLAASLLPHGVQQEGHRHPPASAHFRRLHEDRLVPRASHPRGDEGTRF